MSAHEPDLGVSIRALITARRQALDELEAALVVYERAFGEGDGSFDLRNGHGAGTRRSRRLLKRTGRRMKRRTPLAPGSLPDRIIEILREAGKPLSRASLVEQAKAKEYHVGLTLKELVADRRIVAFGATSTRRYATPEQAKTAERA